MAPDLPCALPRPPRNEGDNDGHSNKGEPKVVGNQPVAQPVGSHTTVISLPAFGTVQLPSKGTLAYFGAVAGLAALGLVEWPVAVIVGVGHMLAQQHGNAVLEEFGEGLGDA